jgi:hypothetical protein
MNYEVMFNLIDQAKELLERNPGGKADPQMIAEFKSIEKAMLAACPGNGVVVQKAGGMSDWAAMLYRSRKPKGYTFEQLRTFLHHDLYSLRKAMEMLQRHGPNS